MGKIKLNQYTILAYFLMRSFFLGIVINNLLITSKQDALLSIILSFVFGLIPLTLFYFISNHHKKFNINDLIDHYFPKIIAYFLKLLLVLLIIFLMIISLWKISDFVSLNYLYKAPAYIIALLFILPIYSLANKRLSTIGRTVIIFFILSTVLSIISSIFLITKINLLNLKPTLEYGISPILKGSLFCANYTLAPLFPLLIIPQNSISNNFKSFKSLLIAYTIAGLFLFLTIFFIISVLGIDLTLFYEYPEFHVLKLITFGNFIQRLESILSFQWFFDFIVSLSFFMYYIKTSIEQIFKVKKMTNHLILTILIIIIIIITNNIFIGNTIAYNFFNTYFHYISFLLSFVIPIIILIVIKTKKKI